MKSEEIEKIIDKVLHDNKVLEIDEWYCFFEGHYTRNSTVELDGCFTVKELKLIIEILSEIIKKQEELDNEAGN